MVADLQNVTYETLYKALVDDITKLWIHEINFELSD